METALRCAVTAAATGQARGSLSETLDLLGSALALTDGAGVAPRLRASALVADGGLAVRVRGPLAAQAFLDAALPQTPSTLPVL